MSTVNVGNKFTMQQLGSLGLTGFNVAVLNGSGEKIAYVKRGKKISGGIKFFSDEGMNNSMLSVADGKIITTNGKLLGTVQGKFFISKKPLTLALQNGIAAEIRTGSLLKQYFRNMGYSFIPVTYGLFVGNDEIATYTLPLAFGKSKLLCEVKKADVIDGDVLAVLGSILILGY